MVSPFARPNTVCVPPGSAPRNRCRRAHDFRPASESSRGKCAVARERYSCRQERTDAAPEPPRSRPLDPVEIVAPARQAEHILLAADLRGKMGRPEAVADAAAEGS